MGCFDPKQLAPQGFGDVSAADIAAAVSGGTVEFTQFEQNLAVITDPCTGEPTWRSRFNDSGTGPNGPNQTFITLDQGCDEVYTQYWLLLEPGWTWGTANPYAGKFAMRILGGQAWSTTAQLDAQAAAGTNGSAGVGWSSFAGQTPTTNPSGPAAITTYDYHQPFNAPPGEQFGDYGTGSAGLVIPIGEWVCVEQCARLNTPGVNDGLHEVRVNGQTVISDTRQWRAAGQTWQWERISTNHAMGGPAGGSWAPQNPPQYQQHSAMRWSCDGWIGCCPEFAADAETRIAAALLSCNPTPIAGLVCRGSLTDAVVAGTGTTGAAVNGETLMVTGGTGTVTLSTSCECAEQVTVTGSTVCGNVCCLLENADQIIAAQVTGCDTFDIPAGLFMTCADTTTLTVATTGGIAATVTATGLTVTKTGAGSLTLMDGCCDV